MVKGERCENKPLSTEFQAKKPHVHEKQASNNKTKMRNKTTCNKTVRVDNLSCVKGNMWLIWGEEELVRKGTNLFKNGYIQVETWYAPIWYPLIPRYTCKRFVPRKQSTKFSFPI